MTRGHWARTLAPELEPSTTNPFVPSSPCPLISSSHHLTHSSSLTISHSPPACHNQPVPEPAALLPELERLMKHAGRLAQQEREKLKRELKPDGTIVTNADRAVETYFREELPKFAPGSTVWGEEFGFAKEGDGGLWVVDPVDGTTNFAFGSPLWGVTVGYILNGEIVAGAIELPDLGESYLASKGRGATLNGAAIPAIRLGEVLPHEPVSCSQYVLKACPGVKWPGKWRCSGAFVIDGMYTATGRFRGMVGIREKIYDIGAALIINAEVGAEIRYADGTPFDIAPLLEDRSVEKPWVIFPQGSGFSIDR